MSVLFTNVTALLMDEGFTTLKGGFVAVEGQHISYVGARRPAGAFDETIDCAGRIMLPGLVNAHTHIPMTLMRGYGGGHDLHTWLNDYIFPAEARLTDRAVAAGAALGLAEMIASGITCIADMYDHCEAIVEQVLRAGISANIARGTTLFAPDYDFRTFPGCVEQAALVRNWHGYNGGQLRVDACIHGEYTSRPQLWADIGAFARENGLRAHVHISETRSEHKECLGRWGKTPIQILDQYGVWANGGIAAHCVYATPEDWAVMRDKDVSCVHNPYSNLKLGSGVAPIPAMERAGVNIALGTDGMSSHNSADLFADMKLAAVLHNGVSCDPAAVTARQALEMATVRGALALGRTDTGRIAPGYVADLILVDFDAPNLIPCHSEAENLVFACHGSNVVMNMARGRVIYKNGEFLTLDLAQIKSEVRSYALPLIFG